MGGLSEDCRLQYGHHGPQGVWGLPQFASGFMIGEEWRGAIMILVVWGGGRSGGGRP